MNAHGSNYNNKTKRITRTEYQRSRSKKIIIAIFCAIIALIILCFAIMGMINQYYNKQTDDNNDQGTLIFHEADFERNILLDKNYLDLDRVIRYENTANGITVAMSKDDLSEVPTEQKNYLYLACEFIDLAINGDYNAFNELFSDEYVEAGGELKLKFTMQQLYDIKITYITASNFVEGDTTVNYYDYWIEYKIRQNNGTFRHDMESDCSRKEYLRISNRNEDYRIDVLTPYKSVEPHTTPIDSKAITILITVTVILLLIIISVVFVITRIIHKKH